MISLTIFTNHHFRFDCGFCAVPQELPFHFESEDSMRIKITNIDRRLHILYKEDVESSYGRGASLVFDIQTGLQDWVAGKR
ncbi:hypothetical protein M408DRAFT_271059 [Serendipita vermifera MAFF 305830]|uniref:Uncharacterized protein n=1 Tax=Serendipita vermifera MAFF 305830 TaxID=933852 RepID=A0A0C2WXF9_SERVB|nr:hypothetical protein M408DRAFT_271059 [Serendipita vermifera MAFF 305830]